MVRVPALPGIPAGRPAAWGAALAVPVVVTLAACDPCSGIVSCEAGLHVAATGRLVVRETGNPVSGVELTFARAGGVALEDEAVTVTTDGDGRFLYRSRATEEGTAVLDVEVVPPERPTYRVDGLRLRTRTVRGDGVDLGRWVVDPYFAFVGELWLRYTEEILRLVGGRGATVVFRRSGGVATERDRLETSTDPFGRFFLEPRGERPGVIRGRLTVRHPDLLDPYTLDPFVIESDHVDRPIDLDRVILVGPSLFYLGELFVRSGAEEIPADGAAVTFRRTGGIPVEPDTFTVEVGPGGEFSLETKTRREGEVVGELIFEPEGGLGPDTVPEIRMETFSADTSRILDRWFIEEAAGGALLEAGGGGPTAGSRARSGRTGGIRSEPDTLTVRSDGDGRFSLH